MGVNGILFYYFSAWRTVHHFSAGLYQGVGMILFRERRRMIPVLRIRIRLYPHFLVGSGSGIFWQRIRLQRTFNQPFYYIKEL
jgi:hypothetical protein